MQNGWSALSVLLVIVFILPVHCFAMDEIAALTATEAPRICRAAGGETKRGQCFNLRRGTTTNRKGKKVQGRCQPQSLIYARCRSGNNDCRLGDTSPVQWFNCARSNRDTSVVPVAGSIMVLDANKKRGMPTGHPVYVEEVCPNRDGTYSLRISHTNYDRRCSLDLDARVHYNPRSMQVAFKTGPWKSWASDLKTLGFILR